MICVESQQLFSRVCSWFVLMPDWLGITLGVIALICLLLPPKYDPAIRWKEWLEKERDK